MTRADRILEVIDAGLQRSDEPSYGTDLGRCARCQQVDPAEGSDWCERCRGILLGDIEDDTPGASVLQRALLDRLCSPGWFDADLEQVSAEAQARADAIIANLRGHGGSYVPIVLNYGINAAVPRQVFADLVPGIGELHFAGLPDCPCVRCQQARTRLGWR